MAAAPEPTSSQRQRAASDRTRRAVTIALAVALLVALAAVVSFRAGRQSSDPLAELGDERMRQLEEVTREISEELKDVEEDLRFVGDLVASSASPAERERAFTVLLSTVYSYRQAGLFASDGRPLVLVDDPRVPVPHTDALANETANSVRLALASEPGSIVVSQAVRPGGEASLRVFARRLPGPDDVVFALVVDTHGFFRRLQVLSSPASVELLVLGPHGNPAPATQRPLADAVALVDAGERKQLVAFTRLLATMRAGGKGTVVLDARESELLGLGPASLLAAFVPIPFSGNGQWSVATLSSTAPLHSFAAKVAWRVLTTSLAIFLGIAGIAAYAVAGSWRAAAARLRRSHAHQVAHLHEKAEKVLDHIPAGVMTLADDGRVTGLNRLLRELLHRVDEGGTLREVFSTASPAALAKLEAIVARALSTHASQEVRAETLDLFGSEARFRVQAVPLEPGFPEARVLVVIEDITEVERLGAQLLRTEKLASVGMVAAGIAHEIGTPLGVVRAKAELARERVAADHPHRAVFTLIIEQIDRVVRTIGQLLDFSRPKSPREVVSVRLPRAVRKAFDLLQFEAERRGVTLASTVPDDLAPLSADEDQLEQVLVNLVMNALDACSVGGQVTVSARSVAGDSPSRTAVSIEVADTGCGIEAELVHRLFDPFFTTKKRGQGTGLGLAVVQQIVRSHRGRIELDSTPGTGTRVVVQWPVARLTDRPSGTVPVANTSWMEVVDDGPR